MATHSSILAWRIPWTETARLHSMGSQELDMTERLSRHTQRHTHTHTHTHGYFDGKFEMTWEPKWKLNPHKI